MGANWARAAQEVAAPLLWHGALWHSSSCRSSPRGDRPGRRSETRNASQARPPQLDQTLGFEKEPRRGSASGAKSKGAKCATRGSGRKLSCPCPPQTVITLSRTQCAQSPEGQSRWPLPTSATVPQTQGTSGAHICKSTRHLQVRGKESSTVAMATQALGDREAKRGHMGHAPRPKHATPA